MIEILIELICNLLDYYSILPDYLLSNISPILIYLLSTLER